MNKTHCPLSSVNISGWGTGFQQTTDHAPTPHQKKDLIWILRRVRPMSLLFNFLFRLRMCFFGAYYAQEICESWHLYLGFDGFGLKRKMSVEVCWAHFSKFDSVLRCTSFSSCLQTSGIVCYEWPIWITSLLSLPVSTINAAKAFLKLPCNNEKCFGKCYALNTIG